VIHFAALLDKLSFETSRNNKQRLLIDYFSQTPDPERGFALAALTDGLRFTTAKPAVLRELIASRVDPVLFALSYDFVGDLSETIALLWPNPLPDATKLNANHPPLVLSEIIEALQSATKLDLLQMLGAWLERLDATGRWAMLKLMTGGLRIGVSARLAKTALAAFGGKGVDEIEEVWHGLKPPYLELFAWIEGRGEKPSANDPAPFHPAMLAHPWNETEFEVWNHADFFAEWKWDGIRIQAVAGQEANGQRLCRLYSRTGEDISKSFPDLCQALLQIPHTSFALDGELLILREGRVQAFSVLQQRLNRKSVPAKLLRDFPAHIRAYDLLRHDGVDLRALPLVERRVCLEHFIKVANHPRLDLSKLIAFESFEDLAKARSNPLAYGAAEDAEAVEGIMLKRKDSIYLAGRPKGPWWKWKRESFLADAVLMYAQRGHGKRSSFYSDFTFGVWRECLEGEQLVPIGKAYFGFTDAELVSLDRYVREHTVNKFGPVREVAHGKTAGLVFEIAFEGLSRSSRHKSGLAMRFPRINRIRWDKPAHEAERIETLEALLQCAR
jgi:DNA ligase-1